MGPNSWFLQGHTEPKFRETSKEMAIQAAGGTSSPLLPSLGSRVQNWGQVWYCWSGSSLRSVAGTHRGGSDTALQVCDRVARVCTALSEGDTSILPINQGCTNRMETVRFRKSHQTKSKTVSKTHAKQIESCCLDAQSYQLLLKTGLIWNQWLAVHALLEGTGVKDLHGHRVSGPFPYLHNAHHNSVTQGVSEHISHTAPLQRLTHIGATPCVRDLPHTAFGRGKGFKASLV